MHFHLYSPKIFDDAMYIKVLIKNIHSYDQKFRIFFTSHRQEIFRSLKLTFNDKRKYSKKIDILCQPFINNLFLYLKIFFL